MHDCRLAAESGGACYLSLQRVSVKNSLRFPLSSDTGSCSSAHVNFQEQRRGTRGKSNVLSDTDTYELVSGMTGTAASLTIDPIQ